MNNIGLFDLPAAFLSSVDHGLAVLLPPLARLLFWGMIGAVFSMACYRLLSSQSKLAETKNTIVRTRNRLLSYDGELSGLLQLMRSLLRLSFRQVRLTGIPALIASLPLVFLVIWVANTFAFEKPLPGDVVEIALVPEQVPVTWNVPVHSNGRGGWLVNWPAGKQGLHLLDQYGRRIAAIDGSAPVLHKKVWWNSLLANPSGYISQQSPLQQVEIGLGKCQYLLIGPLWLRGWEAVFISALLIISILIKVACKIH